MWTTLFHHSVPAAPWGVALAAALVAAVTDLRARRIPNALTLPLLVLGLGHATWVGGWAGLADASLASLLLAAPYLALFAFAGGGAGDAKLMAALGAWLGLVWGLLALVCVSLAGVLVALVRAAAAGRLASSLLSVLGTARGAVQAAGPSGRTAAERVSTLRTSLPPVPGQERSEGEAVLTLPYGVAILLGLAAAAGIAAILGPKLAAALPAAGVG